MDIGNLKALIKTLFKMRNQSNIFPLLAALSGLTAFLVYLDTRKHKKEILSLETELKREQLKKLKNK